VRAVLAAAGGIRPADFDLLLALAGLAAAALAARGSRADAPPAPTDPLDEAAGFTADDAVVDGTLALSTGEFELLRSGQPAEWLAAAATLRLDDWERLLAVEALRRTAGGVPEAAALLGLSRATLYRRLEAFGLTRPGSRPAPP
jgi:DNA-binding NtrC family response regulator